MYVKKNSCKNGRILLTFTHGYRENGKLKQKNIETLGYLDELGKDLRRSHRPFPRNRQAAHRRERLLESEPIHLDLNPAAEIDQFEVGLKNLGYAIFEKDLP